MHSGIKETITIIVSICCMMSSMVYADSLPATLADNESTTIDSFADLKRKSEKKAKPKPTKMKRLAILNSYNENTPWPRIFINNIISEMALHDDFYPVKVAHLNNSIIFDQEDYDELKDRLFEFYKDEKPDYLVLIGNFAFTFRDEIKKNWGDIPMVVITQNDKVAPLEYYFSIAKNDDSDIPPKMEPMENFQSQYNFTSILTRNKYRETIDMMVSMYPDMNKLVFMGDGIYANRHLSYLIKEFMKLKYPNIQYEWLIASENGAMIPYLNNTDPNVGLLLSMWSYAQPGLNGSALLTSGDSHLIRGAHRPVFGLRYAYFNYGILGGYFCDPEELNVMVMDLVTRMIADEDLRNIEPSEITNNAPYINYQKLVTLGMTEEDCPPDTIYIEKIETQWDKYGPYYYAAIICAVAVICLLLLFILTRRKPIFRRDYDTLVNSIPLGFMQVLISLNKEGKIKDVKYSEQNKAMRDIIEENDLRTVIKDEKYNQWQQTVDAIKSDNQSRNVVVKVPNTESYFDFIITPDKHSTEAYFLANIFVIDISDKMRIENVLREAAKKAIEADNMKTNFLANMSHEIRTPLNAIVGFSHLLCRTNDRKKMDQFIEIIETNNQLLLKLIGDVLDLSKADANKLVFNMQTIDANGIITSVCRSADLGQKPDVSIIPHTEDEKCLVTTDPYRVTQVLSNLLSNAIKFTERGHIDVGFKKEGKMLRFYVKDTGMGFSESDKPKLFTRFTKLNSFMQGTGLGLSISKSIVENLGGSMKAESAGRGKGSEFSFTIPNETKAKSELSKREQEKSDEQRLADLKKKVSAQSTEYGNIIIQNPDRNQVNEPPKEKTNLSSYKQEKKKILVVEDNSSNFMLLEAIIDGRCDIVHAWDGEEAIKLFAKETPDIVLMDINLPYKNGYEATAEIRMLSKTVPIIAVTAYAQDTDKEKIISSGFNGYISKPIVENDLLKILKQFL